jgi:hypothetical protein
VCRAVGTFFRRQRLPHHRQDRQFSKFHRFTQGIRVELLARALPLLLLKHAGKAVKCIEDRKFVYRIVAFGWDDFVCASVDARNRIGACCDSTRVFHQADQIFRAEKKCVNIQ